MRRMLIVVGSILAVALAAAATAIACGNKSEAAPTQWHGWTHGAKLFALLTPPSSPTGSTGSTGETGSTGVAATSVRGRRSGWSKPTEPTGVNGIAVAFQNAKGLKLKVGLRGLTAGGTYTIGLYQDVDGQGCASTTNALLDPPGSHDVTATQSGFATAKLVTAAAEFSLDLSKQYYVKVSDSTGATAACGSFMKLKRHHHGWGSRTHH